MFSKPQLVAEPREIYEGDQFKFSCSVSIYVPERINNGTLRFSIYKDNIKLTNSDTYINVGHPSKNGNYTCKAESSAHNLVKESQIVILKAKSKS